MSRAKEPDRWLRRRSYFTDDEDHSDAYGARRNQTPEENSLLGWIPGGTPWQDQPPSRYDSLSVDEIARLLRQGTVGADTVLTEALESLERSRDILEEEVAEFAVWRRQADRRRRHIDRLQDRIDRNLRDLVR